jgi:hypothetical protein
LTDPVDVARAVADQLTAGAERAARDVRYFLASQQGRQMRANLAKVMLASAPALASVLLLRRSWLGRVLGAAGAATVLVAVAEAIRDWEPMPKRQE